MPSQKRCAARTALFALFLVPALIVLYISPSEEEK
jgi:hypothetical protein